MPGQPWSTLVVLAAVSVPALATEPPSAPVVATAPMPAAGPASPAPGRLGGDRGLPLPASPASPASEPGSELTVSLLTFGPGEHPFFKFGHNAIWVHDAVQRVDWVYNFGTFGFDTPWLILDFLKGRLRYWLSVGGIRETLAVYRFENRTVLAQELRMTPAQRLALARALEVNALDENKYYRYDYYRDNCSTRVRDVIDRAIGGQLQAASRAPASMTWRQHTLRLTADSLWVYFGLDAAMGHLIDTPVTRWEEMFLPQEVADQLRRTTVLGPSGEQQPLVVRERLLVDSTRPPPRETPPDWKVPFALVGLALGGAVALLGAVAARSRAAGIAASLLVGSYGLFFGLLGAIFTLLWAFTDHEVTYRNENVLLFAPFALLLVPAAVRLARRRPGATRLAARVLSAAAALAALEAVAKLVPAFGQENGVMIALLMPTWLGSLAGLVLWRRDEGRLRGSESGSAPARRRGAA
jgi:hypothetical protein